MSEKPTTDELSHAGVASDGDVAWAKEHAEAGGSCPPRTTRALAARDALLAEALPWLEELLCDLSAEDVRRGVGCELDAFITKIEAALAETP